MRSRRTPLAVTLLLVGGLLGGPATAAAAPRISYGSIDGTITDATNGCKPFDNTHVVIVEAFDGTMTRIDFTAITDGTGVYSLSSLPPTTYKVRIRALDADLEQVAYVWFGGGTTYASGGAVEVYVGQSTDVSVCVGGFIGGTFKGRMTSTAPGFDPTCVQFMAFEEASGIMVGGLLAEPRSDGYYRYHGTIPAGTYTALAMMSKDPSCAPIDHLDQWWRGHSGPSLFAVSNADLFSSGATFTITSGGVTNGIHFKLMPIGTCNGLVPTIVGTTADDVITGTGGPDVFQLFSGDDEAAGLGGKDTMCGGPGADLLTGGHMKDRIFGQGGMDYLVGGDGNDLIYGGSASDQVFGGLGNDVIRGGSGGDLIHGEEDDDTLRGNKGDDNLYGDDGNDTIVGGPQNDVGWGGTGINTCRPDVETTHDC
jgi:Ca2+-binding RTX toxin-like protein